MAKWVSLAVLLLLAAVLYSMRAEPQDFRFSIDGQSARSETWEGSGVSCSPWRMAYRASLKRLYWGCQWPDTLERETHWVELTPAEVTLWKSVGSRMIRGYSIAPVLLPAPTIEVQIAELCDRYWLWAEDEGARAPGMTRAVKLRQAGCR